jgi:regulator of sigma E protease
MLFLMLGLALCSAAFLGGRWAGYYALGIKGARALAPEAEEAYYALSRARRWAWRLAGPVAVYGICVLLALAASVATGRHVQSTAVEVVPGGPAARAGMLTGDRIVAVNGVTVTAWEQVPKLVAAGAPAGQIAVQIQRGADLRSLIVVPESGRIMVISQEEQLPVSMAQALPAAIVAPVVIIARTAPQVWAWLTRDSPAELSGPVAIARMVGAGSKRVLASALGGLAAAACAVWPFVMLLELVLGPRRRRSPAS